MLAYKFLLIICLLIYGLFSYRYYRWQNTRTSIGGPISGPKMTWLFMVTFVYFILSAFIWYLKIGNQTLQMALSVFLVLIYARAILQSLLMFILKKWTPVMGISYNVFCVLAILYSAFSNSTSGLIPGSVSDWPLFLFIILITLCLLTDSYYAFAFYKIVGKSTMGDQAIWYASDENKQFEKINRHTRRLNYFYVTFFITELSLILFLE